MSKVKITVLKRIANQDLAELYMGDETKAKDILPCPRFEEGQAFVTDDPSTPPDGFCGWAWVDIHREIFSILRGADLRPWTKEPGMAVACCTDGFRPVVFKIERAD